MKHATVNVNVAQYYNNHAMYSVMPRQIFDELEQAFVNDEQTTLLDKQLFDKMIHDYSLKMHAI